MEHIKLRSKLTGWTATVRENYDNDIESLRHWDEIYNIAERLGYEQHDVATLWAENPTIAGSTDPRDLCRIVNGLPVYSEEEL